MISDDTSSAAARDALENPGLLARIKAGIAWRRGIVRARMQARFGPISYVRTNEPVVALTFDDGPHPQFTPQLLEVLRKHGAHATFFMLGTMARRHPEIVREVAERGHAIGNHTSNHLSLPLVSRLERWKQIRSCSGALGPYEQKLFRPPYGQYDLGPCVDAAMLGYSIIGWNAHAFDWLDHDAEWMAKHMVAHLQPGSIITLHDALHSLLDEKHADRTPTIQAVDLLLEQMGHRYRFVTVPELLKHGTAEHWDCFGKVDLEFLRKLKLNDGSMHEYGANPARKWFAGTFRR
jgi:peptidoglycan-N-acetylglucosamine deacetylase